MYTEYVQLYFPHFRILIFSYVLNSDVLHMIFFSLVSKKIKPCPKFSHLTGVWGPQNCDNKKITITIISLISGTLCSKFVLFTISIHLSQPEGLGAFCNFPSVLIFRPRPGFGLKPSLTQAIHNFVL